MANRYWVGGTDNWDGTAGNKWATTSGGAGGSAIPTTADDVFIDNKNAPNWAASTAYALGVIRCPNTGNGYFYEVTTAGTTAAAEPVWPTVVGNTVVDGTVTWTCRLATVTKTTNVTCISLNFTNYIGTWTINNGITQTLSSTITLGSGMTYTQGTTGVMSTAGSNTAVTINFNGVTIPRLTCGFTAGGNTQTVTINGTTPTVQNLTISNISNGVTSLANTALTITNSLTVSTGGSGGSSLAGVSFNIGGGSNVDINTSGRIASGFTVLTGTTLRMQSNLLISGGTITFNAGSFLTHNSNTLSFAVSSATLNSPSINWHNVTYEPGGNANSLTLLSDLDISNNLTTSISTFNSIVGSGGTRNINIQGSFSMQSGGFQLTMTNTIVNLIGTGILDAASGYSIVSTTININTSNPSGYTIGSSTRNFLNLSFTNLNLVGTSVATVNTGHSLRISGSSNLSTNNTITGANIVGGSEIIWNNLSIGAGAAVTLTLSYDTKFIGNLTTSTTNAATINTGKLLLEGNFSPSTGSTIGGTSTIEFTGSNNQNWNSTISVQNNITINKSGGTLTLLGTITWGLANRTLQLTAGNINQGSSTITLSGTPLTINGMIFNSLTIPTGTTINQNTTNTISGTLVCSGSATFAGTAGWNAFNFTTGGAGSIITLQEGITYNVSGLFTMIGTAANRVRLQSSLSTDVTVTIAPLSNQMFVSVGGIPNPAAGFVLGSRAFSTQLPAALINLLPDRPTIASGLASPYTLVNPIGVTGLNNFAGQVGKKAFFNVTGTTPMNVLYAETRDIDSSGGISIYAQQSFADSTSTPNLFRTINWVTLVAPSGSAYYTFVC